VLAVGRVDLANMPGFAPLTETDLLRRYLAKEHAWRTGNGRSSEKPWSMPTPLAIWVPGAPRRYAAGARPAWWVWAR